MMELSAASQRICNAAVPGTSSWAVTSTTAVRRLPRPARSHSAPRDAPGQAVRWKRRRSISSAPGRVVKPSGSVPAETPSETYLSMSAPMPPRMGTGIAPLSCRTFSGVRGQEAFSVPHTGGTAMLVPLAFNQR